MYAPREATFWDGLQNLFARCLYLVEIRDVDLEIVGTLGMRVSQNLGISSVFVENIENLDAR